MPINTSYQSCVAHYLDDLKSVEEDSNYDVRLIEVNMRVCARYMFVLLCSPPSNNFEIQS